jgi:putative ABC transport system permease protein
MRRLRAWFLRLAGLLNKQRREHELADELESHLQLHIEDNLRAGMTPVEARRQALMKLGGVEQTKEIYRDRRGFPLVEALFQDVRYGLRTLRRSPGFTSVAVLTLALGIGANTAIFSVIYGGLLNPLPYADSHRLVVLVSHNKTQGRSVAWITASEFMDYREKNLVFDEVVGADYEDLLWTGGDLPRAFQGVRVTGNLFRVLGVQPLIGRPLSPTDSEPGAAPVAVLSYEVWRGQFGADPEVVGRKLVLNHRPTIVVGVMPPRFKVLAGDLWLPAILSRGGDPKAPPQYFSLMGHLKPGVAIAQAAAAVALLSQRLATVYPQDHPKEVTFGVESYADAAIGEFRKTLYLLFGAVSVLLVIACINVANLLLARATAREKETTIRSALGAGRGRLVRQFMMENLLLAFCGAVLGVALAWVALDGLVAIIPPDALPLESLVRINGPALLFTVGVALLSTLVFGLTPALHAARVNLQDRLKATARGAGESVGHGRLRNMLVVSEVSLALVLLSGGGLLIRSFFALYKVELGYKPDNVLLAFLELPEVRYQTAEQRNRFQVELLRRVRALPGVVSAAIGAPPPRSSGPPVNLETTGEPGAESWRVDFKYASDRYFETLGIPLLSGRAISEEDMDHARKIAVINRAFVTRYFGGKSPLGRQVKAPALATGPYAVQPPWFEIVGVAEDIKDVDPESPAQPTIYVPPSVNGFTYAPLLVHTAVAPVSMSNPLRKVVADLDKELPVLNIVMLRDRLGKIWYSEPRFVLTMLGTFASLGLMLVSIGIYGVLSYSVSQRTHEIGVRMALGAQPNKVRWLVLNAGLRLLLMGISIGVPASIALARILQNRIWGIKTADPLTLGAVVLVLAAVGLAAAYLPARRATQVDPMVALRFE